MTNLPILNQSHLKWTRFKILKLLKAKSYPNVIFGLKSCPCNCSVLIAVSFSINVEKKRAQQNLFTQKLGKMSVRMLTHVERPDLYEATGIENPVSLWKQSWSLIFVVALA